MPPSRNCSATLGLTGAAFPIQPGGELFAAIQAGGSEQGGEHDQAGAKVYRRCTANLGRLPSGCFARRSAIDPIPNLE